MKRSYEQFQPDESTTSLANELAAVIINANVTYKKATEALEYAQRLLEDETKPVKL